MWWKALDMMEWSTIVSSMGTLAIAISTLYQIRRTQRESFYPILSVDDAKLQNANEVNLRLQNYGTGPALHVRLELRIDGRRAKITTTVHDHPLSVFHVGMNETKDVRLLGAFNRPRHMNLIIQYECIHHRHFHNAVPLDEFLNLAQNRRHNEHCP